MLHSIQILRAVAAYLVVFVHMSELAPRSGATTALAQIGYSGVDLFFVISGFIMVHTTTIKKTSGLAFITNRIKRVAPLYYAVTLFVFALAIVAPSAFQSTTTSFAALLKSLAFIPFEKTPGRIYPIYYLGWTLNYEMFFYIVFAICLQLHYKTRVYSCIAVIAGCVALRELFGESEIVALYWYSQPIMLDFVLGMILALNRDRIASVAKSLPAFPLLALAIGIAGLVIAASSVFQVPASVYDPPTKTFLFFGIPAMFIVASGIAVEPRMALRGYLRQALEEIGNASYSIYLTHYFVVGAYLALANRIQATAATRLLLCVAALASTAIVGIAVYRLFERPIGQYLSGRPKASATGIQSHVES